MTTLDPRVTRPGLNITVATLVAVFADHFRGVPAAMTCPGCGHRFGPSNLSGDCPTNTVVRQLLQHRQHENLKALTGLSADAFDNLRKIKSGPLRESLRANTPARLPGTGDLFDVTPYRRTGGTS